MTSPRFIIEADNPNGTYSRVAHAGIMLEAEHELRKAAHCELINPLGMPRRLSVWHMESATCVAVWTPPTETNP
jgi:hypothetical protein